MEIGKEKMNIGLIITARVRSNRLKEKVLQEINGLPTIEILLNHVINDKYPVILAIPNNKEDDRLEEIAIRKGVEVYRGEDKSPLHRLLSCAEQYGFDHVARITADDILIDLTQLFLQIDFHINKGNSRDYTYLKRIPEGTAAEVISTSALQKIAQQIGNKPVEFISYYLKKSEFNYKEYYPPREYQHSFRLTLDYEEDLILLRVIHSLIKNPGTLDIINLLKKNKYLLRINNLPKVTIFTPVHNTSKFVIQTIKSVLMQTYRNFEYIIIDDHSTDDSCNKIAEYLNGISYHNQEKIRFLRNHENLGQATTCNKALEMAKGKYLMCVDSDDILYPETLQTMVGIFESNDTDVIMSGYNRIDENGIPIAMTEIKRNEVHLGCGLVSIWAINELKFKDNIRYEMGTEFLTRLKKDCKITYIEDVLWNYRRRDGQLTQEKEHPQWNDYDG